MTSCSQVVEDDLNMPQAMSALLAGIFSADMGDLDKIRFVEYADRVLALGLLDAPREDSLSGDESSLFELYKIARQTKDFAASDSLRKELAAKGIKVKDTAQGSAWSRS